jgi:opacity protein-like surface antigen
MQKHVLMLTTSAFILAWGAIAAHAQQAPVTGQPPQISPQQQQEHEGHHNPRGGAVGSGMMGPGGMMGQGGMMGHGAMMGQGAMMGPRTMGSGMMMRMLFAVMDGDGDGTLSLQEFQAAHERIFKAMDANKDGRLTVEEMQAFVQGTRRPAPQQ